MSTKKGRKAQAGAFGSGHGCSKVGSTAVKSRQGAYCTVSVWGSPQCSRGTAKLSAQALQYHSGCSGRMQRPASEYPWRTAEVSCGWVPSTSCRTARLLLHRGHWGAVWLFTGPQGAADVASVRLSVLPVIVRGKLSTKVKVRGIFCGSSTSRHAARKVASSSAAPGLR